MGIYLPILSFIIIYIFIFSYPNVGIDKDPPYAYKDKTDNYDASLDAQRVRRRKKNLEFYCIYLFGL